MTRSVNNVGKSHNVPVYFAETPKDEMADIISINVNATLRVTHGILPGMIKAGVPESWLTFPIGTLKTAGAVGLLLGVIGVPLIGTAAAIGLILFFVCALYTHVRARDYSSQFGLANGFLALAVASLVLGLASI